MISIKNYAIIKIIKIKIKTILKEKNKKNTFFITLLALAAGVFFLLPSRATALTNSGYNLRTEAINKINLLRKSQHLQPLRENLSLNQLAEERIDSLVKNNYFSHQTPSGKKVWDLALENNYNYELIGENLAKNFSDADGIVIAWLNSQEHRQNLFQSDYQDIGFSWRRIQGKIIAVAIFGKEHDDNNAVSSISDKNIPENRQIFKTYLPEVLGLHTEINQKINYLPINMDFSTQYLFFLAVIVFSWLVYFLLMPAAMVIFFQPLVKNYRYIE